MFSELQPEVSGEFELDLQMRVNLNLKLLARNQTWLAPLMMNSPLEKKIHHQIAQRNESAKHAISSWDFPRSNSYCLIHIVI